MVELHSESQSSSNRTLEFINRLKQPALWLVILVFAATVAFYLLHITASFDPPYLALALNIVFITAPSFLIAFIASRSFMLTGVWPTLWLGIGTLTFGLGSLLGGLLAADMTANIAITASNIIFLFSAALHSLGAFFAHNMVPPQERSAGRRSTILQVYLAVLALVILVAIVSIRGLLPPFFITGTGGTPIRQMILGTVGILFLAAGSLFFRRYLRSRSDLLYWYSLGLLLTALGMAGVMMQTALGTPLNWMGRGVQQLGGLYLLMAALVTIKQAKVDHVPAADTMARLLTRTQTRLEETERKYATILETAMSGFWLLDMTGKLLEVNDAYARMSGYSKDELLRMSLSDLAAKETQTDALRHIQFVREHGHDQFESRHRRKDGTVFDVDIRVSYMDIAGGREVGFIWDISERKKLEQQQIDLFTRVDDLAGDLLEDNRLLQIIMENTGAHLAYLDPQFNFVMVNSTYAKGSGHTAEELIGKNHFDLFPDEENEIVFKQVRDTGIPLSFHDKPFVFADQPWRGTTYWDWTLIPIKDSSGQNQGLVLSLIDTTEHKKIEQTVLETEGKYRLIVETASEGIWTVDAERQTTYVNETMAAMLGYSVAEMMAKSWRDLTDPESQILSDINIEKRKQGVKDEYEYKLIHKDGSPRWFIVKAAPAFDKDGKFTGTISMLTDITKRKQAEERISHLATFPDLNPNPVVEADLSGNITYSNPAANNAFPDLLQSGGRHPFLSPWEDIIRETANSSQPLNRELSINGSVHLQTIQYVKEGNSIRVYSRDITQRKQAEESLRETRDYLDSLVNHASAPIAVWDTELRITRFNRAFERLTGYEASEVVGRQLPFLFPEISREESLGRIHSTQTGEHWEAVEIPILCKDGGIRTILWNSATLFAADGRTPIATIAQGQDITERKRAEIQLLAYRSHLEELVKERTAELQKTNISLKREIAVRARTEDSLRSTEASFRNAIANNVDGMVIIDKQGKVLFANGAGQTLFGKQASELEGSEFGFPVATDEFMEIDILRDDGMIATAEMRMAETRWQDKDAYLTLLRDITERKQAERREDIQDAIYRLFLEAYSEKEYLNQSVHMLREFAGCRCLGIRVVDERGNIPYQAQDGFSEEFLKTENFLSLKQDQCACIRVVADRSEPQDGPAMTPGGSFCSNDITAFVNALTPEQLARFRGVCVKAGFHTVGIIPIRYAGMTFGAIHLADERAGALPPKTIQIIESIAPLIGEAIHRFRVEQELRENQARLAEAQRIAHLGNWNWDIETNELTWSDEVYSIFGLTEESSPSPSPQAFEVTYDTFLTYVHPDDRDMVKSTVNEALKGKPYDIDHRIILPDGSERVVHERGEVSFNEAGKPIRMFGTVHDVTEQKRAEQELRNLSNRIVETQENERRTIAREMHDVLGQSLTVLKLIIDKAAHEPPEGVKASLQEAQATVDEVVQRVRNLSLELRPSMLDDLGLLPTLLWYCDRYGSQTKLRIVFKHSGLDQDFPVPVSTAAYRIVQEALTNATRHANVDEITVSAWTDKNALFLTIEDRGAGFDPGKLVAGTSTGLSGMKERALALGGKLMIDSMPGSGTTITAELPLAVERRKRRKV